MKRVLFTGYGGFVGHHCLQYFLQNTDWELVCIDSFRHKGTCRRVLEVLDLNSHRIKVIKHDLSVPFDQQLKNLIFERKIENGLVVEKPIHYIINMASESAVERSTIDPVSCLRNNYELQLNMLEFARDCKGLELFIQISTDEVYGEASPNEAHKEWASILPSNPYAASKAAQEAMAISYWRTYNLPIVITNTMNIIGERQDPEKFLPKLIQNIFLGKEMPIYGDSLTSIGSRIYLHACNMADALVFISKIKPSLYLNLIGSTDVRPDRYNICGDTELNNLELAQMVADILGKELKYRLVPSESARPGYDRRYALDGSKMFALGWKQPLMFRESLERIVNFTIDNPHWLI
jgi:dTDP-glucose 4,6-dehydratase